MYTFHASSFSYIAVWATQSFVQQPADTAVNVGTASVTLHCAVNEKTGDLFWIKDDELLGSDTNAAMPGRSRYSIVGDAGQGQYNLQITEVTLDDDGVFHCQVARSETDDELSSSRARLTVQSKLTPPPKKKKETKLTSDDRKKKKSLNGNCSEQFWYMKAYNYMQACFPLFYSLGGPSTVDIAGSDTMSVVEAEPFDLSCAATSANPAATISWFCNNKTIDGATYSSKRTPNDPSEKLWDAESVLTITPSVTDDDNALYECQASNAAISDHITDSITLDVQRKYLQGGLKCAIVKHAV